MKYRLVKNPQLLTLVNPGKPPKKRAAKTGGTKVTTRKRRSGTKRKATPKQLAALRRGRAKLASMRGFRRNAPKKAKKAKAKKVAPAAKKTGRKATPKQLAALAKARAAYKRIHGASAAIKRKSPPRSKPTAASKALVSARKARTKRAKRLGVSKQGWYPRGGDGTKTNYTWVGNKSRRRKTRKTRARKSYRSNPRRRRQTPAQRRASLRNLRKARRAQGYKSNPRRKARKTGKRRSYKSYRSNPSRKRRTSRRRYRRNQGLMTKVMAYLKPALAGGLGFFGSRLAGNFVAQQTYVTIPEGIRPYLPLLANIATAVAAPMILKKVEGLGVKGLGKYSEAVVVGALVAAVENVVTMIAPPSVQAYVAPPLGAGLGDALTVYERALSGYSPRRQNLHSLLAAQDGVSGFGEYITEPGVGEYITEPGMGEYITEPGMGEYITEPGMGVDIEEAFADDYDLAGVDVEEAVAGLDGFDIQADEGLADHIHKNETGGGIFGAAAAIAPGPAVRKLVNKTALTAKSKGADVGQAATVAYTELKSAMGLPTGNAQLRDAVVRAVERVFACYPGRGVRDVPMAMPDYPVTKTDWAVDGAPGPVEPIGSDVYEPFGEPTPVDDPWAANVGGIFRGSIFSNN